MTIDEIDPDDYEVAVVPVRRPRLMTPLSWILAMLLTLGVGIYAGVLLQKRAAPATTAPTAAAGRARTGARAGAGIGGAGATGTGVTGTGVTGTGVAGTGGSGTAGANGFGGTRGSVVLVDQANSAIYIQDSQGNNVKIEISPQTVMQVSKTTTNINDYTVGATIVVVGKADADGTVAATAITEGGGFAGAGAGGGGSGGGGRGVAATGAAATPTTTP
ncbi:MAG: hypothetical protein ABIQ39_06685 [Ilumatobacteraceae bacterium]